MVNAKRAAAKTSAVTPSKKKRTVAYTVDVRQIDRKQNGRFDVYSDFYFVGMPEDNARAMPMMTTDSVGWKQTKGAWAPEVPPPNKNYLRRSKVEKKVTACTPPAMPEPMAMSAGF
jgi:hypothetical protein